MPFVIGVRRLSHLVIDIVKNWGGQRIDNVGPPDTDDDVPRARAGDILSGRFPQSRMPDGTSGYFLKAQGVGADPVYAVAPGMIYTQITTPPTQSGISNWTDWDLSATIPAGAKAVVVQWNGLNGARNPGCRKNGSTSTYTAPCSVAATITWVVELDSSRIIEIVDIDGSVQTFRAIGYFS